MPANTYSREYIDSLVQYLIKYGYTKDVEKAISMAKEYAKTVISANESVDSIRKKYPSTIVPSKFYDLVEVFYHSFLQEKINRD